MLISVTAICTCALPSISYILRCWSPSCARGHSTRSDRGSFVRLQHWLQPPGKGTYFLSVYPSPQPLLCQLPGFRGVKACIIFHQHSVLISTKAAAMEQPLRLFAGLNFTDVRLLSFPRLSAAQRGWICKTNAAVCVRRSQVVQKGRFSQPMGWRKSALCGRQINQKQKPACRRSNQSFWCGSCSLFLIKSCRFRNQQTDIHQVTTG